MAWQFLIPAAGMAMQAGGSMLNAGGRNAGYDNRFGPNSPLRGFQAKMDAFNNEANDVFNGEVDRFLGAPTKIAASEKDTADYFAANSSGLPTTGPTVGSMPVSQSALVLQDAKPKMDKVAAYNTQQGNALAKLRSFGDFFGDAGRGLARDRAKLDTINNYRAGQAAILPLDMQGAVKQPSQNQSMLGDILKLGGSLMTMYGLSGGGGGFTGTPQGLSTYGSPGYAASLNYGGPK